MNWSDANHHSAVPPSADSQLAPPTPAFSGERGISLDTLEGGRADTDESGTRSRKKGDGTQRDQLVSIADQATFWKCPDSDAYASIPVRGHTEHHAVRSNAFRAWLIAEAGRAFKITVAGRERPATFGKNAIEDAIAFGRAEPTATGVVKNFSLRVAATEDAIYIYIDLGGRLDARASASGVNEIAARLSGDARGVGPHVRPPLPRLRSADRPGHDGVKATAEERER